MKKAINRCLIAGLALSAGILVGCDKRETSPAAATEKKIEATPPAETGAAVSPAEAVKPPANPETAIPKDHPAH